MPHILRLDDADSDSAIVISQRRAWSPSRGDFPVGEDRALLGLALDGATVDGGVLGSFEIEETADGLVATVRGRIAGRDTVPVEAVCRVHLTGD